jgi:hypothetical protein
LPANHANLRESVDVTLIGAAVGAMMVQQDIPKRGTRTPDGRRYRMSRASVALWLAMLGVILLLVPGAAFLAAADSDKPALREKDPPKSWKLAELNKPMPYHWDDGTVRVLAWEVIADGKDVMERCLVIKQFSKKTDDGESCALGYLLRSPKTKKPEWVARTFWITPDPAGRNSPAIWGYECYSSVPTDKEIAKFLSQRRWRAETEPSRAYAFGGDKVEVIDHDPKLVDGGICAGAWKKVFDRKPTAELFPELSVEPRKKPEPLPMAP